MHLQPVLLALFTTFSLSGCLSDPYNVPDPGPVATLEEPSDGRYTVTYRGAPSASAEKVRDLALLRAASITLQKGGTWFEVVTEYSRVQEETKTQFQLDPFNENQSVRKECGVLGCPSTARPDELIAPRDKDPKAARKSFPTQSFEIVVHSGERPQYKENTYDAVQVSEEMRQRYSGSSK